MSDIIIRYSEPNFYDQAPYGAICKVAMPNNCFDLYRQTSEKEDHPKWEHVGLFNQDDDIPFLKDTV